MSANEFLDIRLGFVNIWVRKSRGNNEINFGSFECINKFVEPFVETSAFRAMFAVVIVLLLAAGSSSQTQIRPASNEIVVKSEPNATIWINDVRYGETDESGIFRVRRSPAGRKTIRVRAYGFKEGSVPLISTKTTEVQITLTKTDDKAELAYQDAERSAAIDRGKAVELYKKAIELRPVFPEAYLGLARTQAERGSIEAAFAAINSALRLRPVYAEALAVKGRLLKDTGEEARAIAEFKRAISLGRGFQPEAHTGLGILYQERAEMKLSNGEIAQADRDYDEAAKNLTAAIKQLGGSPDAGTIFQLLGRILEHQQKFEEAIALYQEFLADFPDSVDAPAVASFIVQLRKQLEEQ